MKRPSEIAGQLAETLADVLQNSHHKAGKRFSDDVRAQWQVAFALVLTPAIEDIQADARRDALDAELIRSTTPPA